MFGTFLRLERKRLKLNSASVAKDLGELSETYYRLIESGRASLSPSVAFKLISLFPPTAGLDGAGTIAFERLALFLFGAQWVGSDMASGRNRRNADLLAVESLAENDEDFTMFLSKTREYYSLAEGSEKQKVILGKHRGA